MVEKELQATVEHRPLCQVVIVQHHQQRVVGLQMPAEVIQQAVEPLLESEWLMPLAHFQQAQGLGAQSRAVMLKPFKQAFKETPRVAVASVQAQPQALPVRWQALTELHRKRAFTETGRRTDQQQAPTQSGLQTLAQPRARHMSVGQWRTIETSLQGADGQAGKSLRAGQISHDRLVLVWIVGRTDQGRLTA